MISRSAAMIALLLPVVAVSAADVTLTQKFTPGTSYTKRETASVAQSLSLGGQVSDTTSDTTTVVELSYGQPDENGDQPITTTVKSLNIKLQLPGDLKLTFDSANPDAKADNELLELLLDRIRAINGRKLTFTLNKDREITDVAGVTPQMDLNPDDLKEAIQLELSRLPDKPIQVGDTWQREEKQNLGSGQVFTFQRQYKYAGVENNDAGKPLDRIEFTDESVAYSIKPNQGIPGEVTKSKLKVESSEHVLLFDRELGRVVSQTYDVHITGEIGLSVMNTLLDGELDLQIESTSNEVD